MTAENPRAPALVIRHPGLATTVQDLGRHGYQHLGMTPAGALDPIALRIANALVGNPAGTAALELSYLGPEFEVDAPSLRIAVAGPARIERLSPSPGPLAPWRSHRLVRGDVVRVGPTSGASVAVVAVEGGFALPPFLSSLSTYTRAAIGGLDGRALRAGDRLPLVRNEHSTDDDRACAREPDYGSGPVRVVLGPQADYFTTAAIETFLSAEFAISKDSDRMGQRLEGPTLAHARGADIPSEGIACGSIQVPGTGQPILLLVDHQTVGGYPKIATVVSADWPRVGRMLPGMRHRFVAISVAEAQALRRAQERMIGSVIAGLIPARPPGGLDEQALWSRNLVSGVVDARA